MAYAAAGLRRQEHRGAVGNGDGSVTSEWAYDTNDTAAVVEAANYFNSAAALFSKGDTIEAVMARGGTPVLKKYVVTSATGATTVVIALQTTTAG